MGTHTILGCMGAALLLSACGPDAGNMTGQEQGKDPDEDQGTGSISGTGAVPGTGGAPAAGGAAATGGAETGGASSCELGKMPSQTYLCAGTAYEDAQAGLRVSRVYPDHPDYACDRYPDWYNYDYYGYYDYYWEDYPEEEGDFGMAGAAGAGNGGAGYGGAGYGGYGASPIGGAVAIGGSEMGGFPWPGIGGGPPEGEPRSDWCEDAPVGKQLAGLTYAVGECQETEVRLPLRIQEPYGWYELTIYGGSSPCDRGEIIAKTAGFGTNEVLEIPIDYGEAEFLSVELLTEDWDSIVIALREDNPAF